MKLSAIVTAATLTVAALSLAACQSQPEETADASATAPGICRPDAAEALAGKASVTDAQAKQLTGASIVRQLAPGQPATMDYRRERVTIETDPKTGRILRAMCG